MPAQCRPGAVERAGGGMRVARGNVAPTRGNQVVQIGTTVFHGTPRPECPEPLTMAAPRGFEGLGAAAAIAAFGLQMLHRVGLHADQQVEALVAAWTYEGLVDQRLHDVHRPGRIVDR